MLNFSGDVVDHFARIFSEAAQIVPAKREPQPKPVPEPPFPTPNAQPKSINDEERNELILRSVGWAEFCRSEFGRGVVMLDASGSPIEWVNDLSGDPTPRRVVSANFKMVFTFAREMAAIALPIYDEVVVTGPERAVDGFGEPLFPSTTTFKSKDHGDGTISRIFRPAMMLTERVVCKWRSWSVVTCQGLLPLDGIEKIHLPRNTASPFAHLPEPLLNSLLNPEARNV